MMRRLKSRCCGSLRTMSALLRGPKGRALGRTIVMYICYCVIERRRRRKQKKKKKQETKMTHHPIIYNPVLIYNILGIVTAFAIVIVLEFFNQRPWLLGKGTKPPREDRLTPTRSI